tara:strand:- start:176 stop:1282 length:1107 start_codon:yes stop_codon:yes gene_type:complete
VAAASCLLRRATTRATEAADAVLARRDELARECKRLEAKKKQLARVVATLQSEVLRWKTCLGSSLESSSASNSHASDTLSGIVSDTSVAAGSEDNDVGGASGRPERTERTGVDEEEGDDGGASTLQVAVDATVMAAADLLDPPAAVEDADSLPHLPPQSPLSAEVVAVPIFMSDEVVSETHNVSDAARKTEETLRFYENFERDFEKNFSQADATDTDYSGSGSGSDENENENEDEDAWAERWEREQWAARNEKKNVEGVATPLRRFSLADGSSDAAAATFGPGGLSLGERTPALTTIVSLDAFAALLDSPTEDRLGDVDDEGKCRGETALHMILFACCVSILKDFPFAAVHLRPSSPRFQRSSATSCV